MLNTPVLFLIFNREDSTQKVFDAIRLQKPKYLFVAADGARKHKPDEAEKCRRTRDIIKQIDWDCEFKTLFRDNNLGCKLAVSSAITWFFENVEQGIILEDDCLPDPSFFSFCEELLEKYKDDMRIGHIGGNNFLPDVINEELSYDFCSCTHIWGWASWRRVWKNYDVNFPFWENREKKRSFLFRSKREEIYFSSFLSDAIHGRNNINTWDTQYWFTLRTQNQLAIYPAVNLVTNIGLGNADASHTSKRSEKQLVPTYRIHFPLKHPEYVLRNKELDNKTVEKLFFSWKRLIRYFLKLY